MEKLQKVYDVFVRDGHISDPAKTPFDKWAASFSDKPEKKAELYDFLAEKQYIKQKPKDQWIGETFGAATPAVVDQKKKDHTRPRGWFARIAAAIKDGFSRYATE